MAKKAKKKSKDKMKRVKKLTCVQFLRDLFKKDKNCSNDKALRLLLAKFPTSRASVNSIITWKNMLRAEGMDIPKQRPGRPHTKKSKSKRKKKARSSGK